MNKAINTAIFNKKNLAEILLNDIELDASTCYLKLPQLDVVIQTNSQELVDTLTHYFRHITINKNGLSANKRLTIQCVERESVNFDVEWLNWSREAGKVGKKDTYINLDGARLLRKARTGMVFLQSLDQLIACGPCVANANQIINFVINQYMTLLQQQDWLICHASALSFNGKGVAFAAFSGGGKSTTMLHLMDEDNVNFVSNDRLFIKYEAGQLLARGVPKLPRINPGTIIHNDKLKPILTTQQIEGFSRLPKNELWVLEEKYDVDIEAVYGEGRISNEIPLQYFIILNWSHDSQVPTQLTSIDLSQKTELLAAIMKSKGPFYQHLDGTFNADNMHSRPTEKDEQAYINSLMHCNVLEVSGQVDFDQLKVLCWAAFK